MKKNLLIKIIQPVPFRTWQTQLALALPPIIIGLSPSLVFGSSKFGMPRSVKEDMGLFLH